jgi:hypothetical protein
MSEPKKGVQAHTPCGTRALRERRVLFSIKKSLPCDLWKLCPCALRREPYADPSLHQIILIKLAIKGSAADA